MLLLESAYLMALLSVLVSLLKLISNHSHRSSNLNDKVGLMNDVGLVIGITFSR